MTAINVICSPKHDRIYIATDTAVYYDNGVVTGFMSKVDAIPEWSCAIMNSAFYTDKRNGPKKGAKYRQKPFTLQALSDFCFAPGLFNKDTLEAAGFPTHLKVSELSPEIDMLHVMEMMRRTPDARFPSEKKVITCGGHALLTRIDPYGVTQKTLTEWPHVIGQPIQVPPPLDWAAWRASREAPQ